MIQRVSERALEDCGRLEPAAEKGGVLLKWLDEVRIKWWASIAHTFLLHQNVDDTVNGRKTALEYLPSTSFIAEREIIICYNRFEGITFPIPEHRKRFLEELSLVADDVTVAGIDSLPRAPEAAFVLIEAALRLFKQDENGERSPKTAVIIDYAETLFPAAETSQMAPADRTVLTAILRIAKDRQIADIGSPVILAAENLSDVHPAVRSASSRIESVLVPLPDFQERTSYIEALNERAGVGMEITVQHMARLTAGLKRLHLEDIFSRAGILEIPVTQELVKERKGEIIESEFGSVLQIIDPEIGFDAIGGLSHIKDYLRRNVIIPMKEGNLRRVPNGILFPGPAGTGKSVLAEALAKESGVNCCALNLSRIMDKWVGSSEGNLEKALECIKTLSPAIVILDEIDQSGLSREGGGDSGVGNRLFKRLLEFMSDTRNRGQVVFIGLTNRPDLMDPALKRPGRFDKKVPVLPPDTEERIEIINVVLHRYGICFSEDFDFREVAEATEGYTGAELEALVLKASDVAEDAGGNCVEIAHMRHALEVYRPTTQGIEDMTRLALAECNDLDLLPPAYQDKLTSKIKNRELRIVPDDGYRKKRK